MNTRVLDTGGTRTDESNSLTDGDGGVEKCLACSARDDEGPGERPIGNDR